MPVTIAKTDGKYKVSTPHGVHAKGTSLRKAVAQKRLLNAVEHGWKPTGQPAKDKGLKRAVLLSRAKKHKSRA